MQKGQVDLENGIVHIADSKTVNGIGDMPMTPDARDAFLRQIEETPGSEYLFPSPKRTASKPYLTNLRKAWAVTLKKVGLPHFALYEVRHTFATRLSAGGVCGPHGDTDAPARRRRSVQVVQPGEARHDAGGAGKARPEGERTAREFIHREAKLTDFITFSHSRPNGRVRPGKEECAIEGTTY